MKILLTGADGQLGKEIQSFFASKEVLVLPYSKNRLDISDRKQINEVIKRDRPDIIINAAAFTKVDLCETEIKKAFLVNAIGPFNLAIEAKQFNCKLIHISTDYVFSGEKHFPYEADDETDPKTVYGKSKKFGEELVLAVNNESIIIRTSWLYGHDGSNFVKTIANLSDKLDEIKVVNDQIGSPTYTKDLVQIIKDLFDKPSGIYHATNLGKCSWYDFACEIVSVLNKNTKVIPVTTEQYGIKTPRPMYSVLSNKKMEELNINQRHWKEALEEFLRKEYLNR